MSCAEIQAQLSLYLYGELDFAAEEIIEVHVVDCSFCQMALGREKEWHAALNRQQQDVRPEWLDACRTTLKQQIAAEPTSAAHTFHKVADALRGLFDFRVTERSYRLAAVSFLLILGFGAGRIYNSMPWTPGRTSQQTFGETAGFFVPTVTRVKEIRPEAGNRVSIVLQQMQMREVSGSRADDGMRALLVGAARESVDPGVRMDSVEMLAGQSGLEIRNAIVNTVKNDPNAAVRVKAIETLRQFPSDPVTREALEFALAHDRDAGVRTEAMDVLVPANGNLQLTPQLLQTLSDIMRTAPDDDYIRLRCAQILNAQISPNGVY